MCFVSIIHHFMRMCRNIGGFRATAELVKMDSFLICVGTALIVTETNLVRGSVVAQICATGGNDIHTAILIDGNRMDISIAGDQTVCVRGLANILTAHSLDCVATLNSLNDKCPCRICIDRTVSNGYILTVTNGIQSDQAAIKSNRTLFINDQVSAAPIKRFTSNLNKLLCLHRLGGSFGGSLSGSLGGASVALGSVSSGSVLPVSIL